MTTRQIIEIIGIEIVIKTKKTNMKVVNKHKPRNRKLKNSIRDHYLKAIDFKRESGEYFIAAVLFSIIFLFVIRFLSEYLTLLQFLCLNGSIALLSVWFFVRSFQRKIYANRLIKTLKK